jgi:signal transduction histidine kinase
VLGRFYARHWQSQWHTQAEVFPMSDFDERLEREKLESLKELAYGASHEIDNPLANIAARAQTLLVDEADPERRRMLVAIHRQAMRAHEMISDLMLFARPPKLQRAAVNLVQIVERVVHEHREIAKERDILLACDVSDASIVLSADETQLAVAIAAVVTNAVEAVGQGGHVQVRTCRSDLAGESWAEVVVRDDGPGISPDVRRHIFDPFFSGREAGRGLGFGLSKCWRIVTDHGGQVVVNEPTGHGAEIAIRLKATGT